MKPVSQLYNTHPNSDIYIVGSGASMRVFPVEFLKDKITIGCNMAWKNAPVKYGITIHADLNVPEFMEGEQSHPEITWIIKEAKAKKLLTPHQFDYADKNFYNFNDQGQPNTAKDFDPSTAGRIVDWLKAPKDNYLYLWSSIAQAAMNLAANMGAKNIFLVGCDNCSLGENHHAHKQHTRWKGVTPEYRYSQYYEGNAEVRSALMERGINVLSLTPFMGLNCFEEDFRKLCERKGKPVVIQSEDKYVITKDKPELPISREFGDGLAGNGANLNSNNSIKHKIRKVFNI